MVRLGVAVGGPIDVGQLGAALWTEMIAASPGGEAALFVAPMRGQGIALGRFQRARSTIDVSCARRLGIYIARRATGGPALRVGEGQLYLALWLRSPDALGGSPDPARLLNRHVRPLLAGLGELGAPAAYGGRDFVSCRGAPIAWVGARHDRRSRTAGFEAIISARQSFAIDHSLDLVAGSMAPRHLGKTPSSLSSVSARPPTDAAVVGPIVDAYREAAGHSDIAFELPESNDATPPDLDAAPFDAIIEEAIGPIGATTRPRDVDLGGDLMVSEDALASLVERIAAMAAMGDVLGPGLERAIDEELSATSGAMLIGVRSLASIARVVRLAWEAQK